MKTLLPWLAFAVAAVAQDVPTLTHGPFRGHVDPTSLHVWARASAAGEFALQLTNVADGAIATAKASAAAEHDFTLHFTIAGLPPASAFTVRITCGERMVFAAAAPWTTALPDDANAATFAFGSCANDKLFPEQPIWARIVARAPHGLVLLGDTPYIDLGTVPARRQRFREFFAVPALAGALAAIPTWTTWDDHDYALNDQFGAVPGSETARPVFVDYHAHADYGDGARGIYTRFRQGPIEVFLLDTRTFADGEASVLAPGARSLLGKAQVEWLQRALLASTAPCKVLACGMVWNGGVRAGKKDCWGNWLPERDALFRWLGANRITGVLLVGGDVHRSRVIVHPTAATVGYDLREFITSPLAQNVIETNKVDVPGLAFDGGEPSSCLFLACTRGDGGEGVLRAVFQAGDGREFRSDEVPLAALRRPEVADAYRHVVGAMRTAFGADMERLPEDDGTLDDKTNPAWRQAVAAGAPAFAAWREAEMAGPCRFRATSREPLMTEFLQELLLGLQSFVTLAQARCLQQLADRDAAGALQTTTALLATVRHLQQEPGLMAWGVAASIERFVAERGPGFAALGGDAAASLRAQVQAHLAARPPLAASAAAARIDVLRLFDGSLAMMRGGKDRKASVAGTLPTEVRRAFTAILDPVFAVADTIAETNVEATVASLRQHGEALRVRVKERLAALRALDAPGEVGEHAADDLGFLLATMLVPDLASFLQGQHETMVLLRGLAR